MSIRVGEGKDRGRGRHCGQRLPGYQYQCLVTGGKDGWVRTRIDGGEQGWMGEGKKGIWEGQGEEGESKERRSKEGRGK